MITRGSKTIRGNTLTVKGNLLTYKTKDGYTLHGTVDKWPTFAYESIVQMANNRDLGHWLADAFSYWLYERKGGLHPYNSGKGLGYRFR